MAPPYCFKGFTPDDIIHYAYFEHERYGVCLLGEHCVKFPLQLNGILLGNWPGHSDHAMAYIAGKVHDPADGCIKMLDDFELCGMIVFR